MSNWFVWNLSIFDLFDWLFSDFIFPKKYLLHGKLIYEIVSNELFELQGLE